MTAQPPLVCYIYGVGAWGPGFADWAQLRNQLLDPACIPSDLTLSSPKAEVIPGNERRRAPPIVRAAVEVSSQACAQAAVNPVDVACVFGSGLGDTEITDYMCTQLAAPEKQLSPTKFHNSVHNAAAGYWTISTHCMQAANSIAAYQHTAGISLMEAALQAQQDQVPVLVSLFDLAPRGIYQRIYASDMDFAAALVLTSAQQNTKPLAKLSLTVGTDPLEPAAALTAFFARLHGANPAARVLPLLHALAIAAPSTAVNLSLADGCYLKILVEK